jgi:2-furoyl-CoA dehydrogenase large subunit
VNDPKTSIRPANWTGQSLQRREDAALLTGAGRYADDLGTRPGTLHAAFLRSPYAHARIKSIDVSRALAHEGVRCVLVGADVRNWARPFVVGVKQPMEHWCIAVDKVRYAGEPIAVVVAQNRYIAEDALDLIEVEYEATEAVVNTEEAIDPGAPVLHEAVGSNVVSDRQFVYGEPDAAFSAAPHRVKIKIRYPRNSCTPIETYVVVAEHGSEGDYDVLSNFMGPFSLHAVMALALQVPAAKLRLRMPRDGGGSFGVKQGVFPYIVALCLAARKAGAPVKWVEDRLEHLVAATSSTGRVSELEAAVDNDGRIRALAYDQLDDCGAYLSHARLPDRRLQDSEPEGPQPCRADQQDAGRSGARLWRTTGVLCTGTAGATYRYRITARPARGL